MFWGYRNWSVSWQIELIQPVPYRKRLWLRAVAETRRYWNAHRTTTAITSPIITALFWVAIRGWKGWLELLYAALLGVGIFFVSWGIAFLVSLAYAPVQLDAALQSEISQLSEQLALPDKAQADHLRALLAKLNENGKAILSLALFHEELTYKLMEASGISQDVIQDGIRNCMDAGLLHWQNNHPDPMSPLRWLSDVYWVSSEIRAPLKRLLHTQ